jgi:hypothetical protein
MPQNKIENVGGLYLLKNERFLSEPLHEKPPNIKLVVTDCARNEPPLLVQILLVRTKDVS